LPDSISPAHHSECQCGALLRNPVRVQLLMLKVSQFRGVLHTTEIAAQGRVALAELSPTCAYNR
jgi:hypothetical protein